MRSAIAVLVFLAAAVSAQAQTLATVPTPPVAGMPFQIRVTMAACYSLTGVTVNGANIDVVVAFQPLCIGTPPFITQEIGAPGLPAGNYTIRLLPENSTTPLVTLPVAITADIPALESRALAMLAAVLALLAIRSAAK